MRMCRLIANLAGLGLLAAVALPGMAQAYDLKDLSDCLARESRFEVAFRQEQLMQSVNETLTSRGRMIYEPPDKLIVVQEEPERERAVIAGDRMNVYDSDGAEVATFELAEQPALQLTFDGIRGLLAGDVGALRSAFEVTLDGSEETWHMRLAPKSETARYHLNGIEVDGGACTVRTIDVRMRSGGRRVIHLQPDGDGE